MSLTIPKRGQKALAKFLNYPDDRVSQMMEVLKAESVCLDTEELASRLALNVDLAKGEAEELVVAVIGLYSAWGESKKGADDFIELVLVELEEEIRLRVEEKNKSAERLRKRLCSVLSLKDFLGMTGKALDLMTEYENIFSEGRVLSDVRPVFGAEVEKPPVGAMVVHTLKIGYRKLGGQKELYVALDARDVRELKECLERALVKEERLRDQIVKGGIRCFETRR